MFGILLGIAYLLLSLELFILVRSFVYARRERKRCRPPYVPRTVILAPHYGWDEQIERNARLLLEQDYPGQYQIFFITHENGGSGPDSSYPHLKRLEEEHPGLVRVVLAPSIVDHSLPRSQKVQNLLTAIDLLDEEVAVIALVDADSRVRRDWLRSIVEPLQDERVGATVGARYYVPQVCRLPALVESVWINFQFLWQGDHSQAMVWGGSTAMHLKTFYRGDVSSRWLRTAFEDHQLTRSMRELGLKISFIPACVVVTETRNRSWGQVMEFTNRQLLVTYRMGLRAQWTMVMVAFVPKALIIFGLLPFALDSPARLAAILAIPFLEGISYFISGFNLPPWLRSESRVTSSRYIGSCIVPLAMLIAVINAINALFRSEIVWGGVRYMIPSATECRVMGRETD